MYYLLPFKYNIANGKEIITNDFGDYQNVPRGTVSKIVNRELDPSDNLYKDLLASYIISEQPVPRLIDNLSVRLSTRKSFLDNYTALHIFVVTLRCNQNCVYCQASSKVCDKSGVDMRFIQIDRPHVYVSCTAPNNGVSGRGANAGSGIDKGRYSLFGK